MSWLNGSEQERPWFHIRSYGVGTSELVAGVSLVMMVMYAISPALVTLLALQPDAVLRNGFIWQVLTWPLFSVPGLGTIFNAVVFWFMGRQVERELGKGRFGWMMLAMVVAESALALVLALAFGANAPILAGLSSLTTVIVLLVIAENPRMPFFFGIPAWVIGLIIVLIPLLGSVASRNWLGLLHLVLSLAVAAIIAKFAGLLSRYAFIPGQTITGQPRVRTPKASRRAGKDSTVVQGPWTTYEAPVREDAEMDALLDKIMASGLDSLTPKERKRLEELRQQRRSR